MQFKNILLAAITGIALTASSECDAQDSKKYPSCPDMSSHTKVLNEGMRKLEHVSAPAYSHRMLPADLPTDLPMDGLIYHWQGDEKHIIKAAMTDEQLSNFSLETVADYEKAHEEAARLEHEKRFDSAYELLRRTLNEERKFNLVLDDTLIQLGRIEIERGLDESELKTLNQSLRSKDFKTLGYGSGRQENVYFYDLLPLLDSAIVRKSKQSNEHWNSALELFEETQKPKNSNLKMAKLNMDYLLLLEWKGRIADAKAEYVRYFGDGEFQSTQGKLLGLLAVNFCKRNDDFAFAQTLEIPLLASHSGAGSMLLWYYLNTNHQEQASSFFARDLRMIETKDSPWSIISEKELASLFPDKTVAERIKTKESLSRSNGSRVTEVSANDEELSVLIPLLSDSQKHAFEIFVGRSIIHKGEFQNNYLTIWELTDKRGWKDFGWETFQLLKNFNRLPVGHLALVNTLAKYLVEKKQIEQALEIYETWLDVLQKSSDLELPERLAVIEDLEASIRTTFKPETSQSKGLSQKADDFKKKTIARIQLEECMNQAYRLDSAGEKLESADAFLDAEKMYRESVEIKLKNLGPNDSQTIDTESRLARALGRHGKDGEAVSLYEKCLLPYRKHSRALDSTYGQVLDSYAQMLSANNQKEKADAVYTEARNYHRSLESTKLL